MEDGRIQGSGKSAHDVHKFGLNNEGLEEDKQGASAAGALSRKVDINVSCSNRANELIASG